MENRVVVYYGKIESLVPDRKETGKKGERETLAGRRLLYRALKEQCRMELPEEPEGLVILEKLLGKKCHGKPFLIPEETRRFMPQQNRDRIPFFNISHSGTYAVCAIAWFPVGVDLQIIRKIKNSGVIKRTLSPAEQEYVRNAPDSDVAFGHLWAQKESYLKWNGEGITRDLRTLETGNVWQEFFQTEEGYAGYVTGEKKSSVDLIRIV